MPNRVLRDWTTSEAIDKLSLGAEVFFTRLIMKADDYGNYTANHKLLRSALFPLRDHNQAQIEVWIDECVTAGIVLRYEVEGKQYINILNFGQRMRQMRNTFPPPADNSLTSGCQLADNGRPETKRNEVETNLKEKAVIVFGDSSEPHFLRIQDKTVNAPITLLYGINGWNEFLQVNRGSLQYAEVAPKFLKKYHMYQFFDSNHLHNTYMKFVEKQYQ